MILSFTPSLTEVGVDPDALLAVVERPLEVHQLRQTGSSEMAKNIKFLIFL